MASAFPQLLNILASQKQQQDALFEQAKQERKANEANQTNPLGVIAGIAGGLLTGGGAIPAILGGLGGLSAKQGEGLGGVARAGLGGYTTGMSVQDIARKLQQQKTENIIELAKAGLFQSDDVNRQLTTGASPISLDKGMLETPSLLKKLGNQGAGTLEQAIGGGLGVAKDTALKPLVANTEKQVGAAVGSALSKSVNIPNLGTFTTKTKPEEVSKYASELRKEVTALPITKQTIELNSQFNKMSGVWQDYLNNPGSSKSKNTLDQSLVITLNKMLDPSSVVRESEFARTPEGISAINRLQAAFQKLSTGGVGLTDEDRQDIVRTAYLLASKQNEYFRDTIFDFYTKEAKAQGVDPGRVLFGMQELSPPKSEITSKYITKEKIGKGKQITLKDGETITIYRRQ